MLAKAAGQDLSQAYDTASLRSCLLREATRLGVSDETQFRKLVKHGVLPEIEGTELGVQTFADNFDAHIDTLMACLGLVGAWRLPRRAESFEF